MEINSWIDLIKCMYNTPQKYSEVRTVDKTNNFFMIQRRMAIVYPRIANALNKNGIEGSIAVDYWFQLISKKFSKVPSEKKKLNVVLYTKSAKKKDAPKKTVRYTPTEDVIQLYLNINKCGMREYNEALKFNETELLTYLKKVGQDIKMCK